MRWKNREMCGWMEEGVFPKIVYQTTVRYDSFPFALKATGELNNRFPRRVYPACLALLIQMLRSLRTVIGIFRANFQYFSINS